MKISGATDWVSLAWLLAGVCLLAGCPSDQPARGTAASQAATAQDRADTGALAADTAEVDAARKGAIAEGLTEQAKLIPTEERIAAAAAAQADAQVAGAVARALRVQADRNTTAAREAAAEYARDQALAIAAAEARERAWWAWWIGAGGVGAGVLAGAALAYLVAPRLGILAGVSLSGAGAAVAGYGAAEPWMLGVLALAAFAVAVAWALSHRGALRFGLAASEALDAAESPPIDGLRDWQDDTKEALGDSLRKAGLTKKIDGMRGILRRWDRG